MKILLFLISVVLIFIYAAGWVKIVLLVLCLLILLIILYGAIQDPMSDTPPYHPGDEKNIIEAAIKARDDIDRVDGGDNKPIENDEMAIENDEMAIENDEPKKLTKEELINIAEGYGISLDSSDEEEVLLSKLNEGLDNIVLEKGWVDIGDEDYRTLCNRCKKKITSEEILPDGYEVMWDTMDAEYCKSCYDWSVE